MNEIEKLEQLSKDYHLSYSKENLHGGTQLIYYENGNRICDVVFHKFSFGYNEGLLEMMGLVENQEDSAGVEGWLTAHEVFTRIKNRLGITNG